LIESLCTQILYFRYEIEYKLYIGRLWGWILPHYSNMCLSNSTAGNWRVSGRKQDHFNTFVYTLKPIHYHTLQHTATHRNTLQHTSVYCAGVKDHVFANDGTNDRLVLLWYLPKKLFCSFSESFICLNLFTVEMPVDGWICVHRGKEKKENNKENLKAHESLVRERGREKEEAGRLGREWERDRLKQRERLKARFADGILLENLWPFSFLSKFPCNTKQIHWHVVQHVVAVIVSHSRSGNVTNFFMAVPCKEFVHRDSSCADFVILQMIHCFEESGLEFVSVLHMSLWYYFTFVFVIDSCRLHSKVLLNWSSPPQWPAACGIALWWVAMGCSVLHSTFEFLVSNFLTHFAPRNTYASSHYCNTIHHTALWHTVTNWYTMQQTEIHRCMRYIGGR